MFGRRIVNPSKRQPFLSSNIAVDRDATQQHSHSSESPPGSSTTTQSRPPPPDRTRHPTQVPVSSRDRGTPHARPAQTPPADHDAAQTRHGRGLVQRPLVRNQVGREHRRPAADQPGLEALRPRRVLTAPSACPPPPPRVGFGFGPAARHAAQAACQAPPRQPPPLRGTPESGGPRGRNDALHGRTRARGVDDPSEGALASRERPPPKSALARKWAIFDRPDETSDTDLELWGRLYIPGFQAVIPRVEFPEVADLEPGHSWVLNLDRGIYRRGGTHWVGVYVSRKRPLVLYFDAFGMPPPKEVTLAAWRAGKGVVRSDVRYQQYAESNCGPRTLAIILHLAKAPDDIAAFRDLAQG